MAKEKVEHKLLVAQVVMEAILEHLAKAQVEKEAEILEAELDSSAEEQVMETLEVEEQVI